MALQLTLDELHEIRRLHDMRQPAADPLSRGRDRAAALLLRLHLEGPPRHLAGGVDAMTGTIAACPGCGVESSENYGGAGLCWECHERGANGAAPAGSADWLAGVPMDPAAVASEPLPAIAGFPFLHAGAGAVIVGPTGGGRSSLIQACAYDAARQGVRVAYLGSEVTEPEFNARAADLAGRRGDLVDDALREQLARVRYLNLASTIAHAWQQPEAWAKRISARFDVVAIDPLSAVASALDLDFDKSNAEFVRFYDQLVQPLAAAGVAVLLLENIGHAVEARSRAKGASAKQDRADLTFWCKLKAGPVGLIVTAGKVRTSAPASSAATPGCLTATRRPSRRTTTAARQAVLARSSDPRCSWSAPVAS